MHECQGEGGGRGRDVSQPRGRLSSGLTARAPAGAWLAASDDRVMWRHTEPLKTTCQEGEREEEGIGGSALDEGNANRPAPSDNKEGKRR